MKKIFLIAVTATTLFSCGGNTDKQITSNVDSNKVSNNDYLYAFEDSNGSGFKDAGGKVVIPAKYSHSFTDTFSHAIAFVADEKEGPIAIDRTGKKVLTPYIFDNGPDYVEEGLFRFVENKKMGFADVDGKIILPARYDFVSFFKNGLACIGKDYTLVKEDELELVKGGKWGFINMKGDTVVPQKYDGIASIHDGQWMVKSNGVNVNIDKDGKEVKIKD